MLDLPFLRHGEPRRVRSSVANAVPSSKRPRSAKSARSSPPCSAIWSARPRLGERLDAEDISRLLRDYQSICRRRIESHGGVVEKFIGDAVVGVFGVPLAHEDDPERAVRAALRIIEDIGASDLGIEVRIGVNTGEALVRLDVDPRSGEGFATGDTMNTAARLEAAAPVMGVAVGAATHRASEGAIVYEALPPISAKGKAEPVPAWQALHPIARVGTEERDRTPFVGRDLELSMLTQLFDRSRSRPSTEFVTIIAEPGLGKSRLVRELARHVDQTPRARHLARGPVPSLRGRDQLLGVGRDREGPGGDLGDRRSGHRLVQARSGAHRTRSADEGLDQGPPRSARGSGDRHRTAPNERKRSPHGDASWRRSQPGRPCS